MNQNDKPRPGLYRAAPETILPFLAAMTQYQDPAKQTLIETVKGGENLKRDYRKATIEYGRRFQFNSILDFFVNLLSLQDKLADTSGTDEWYWNHIETVTLGTQFYYHPELLRLLRSTAGPDALNNDGWLVKYVTGRIDIDTTWADSSYLISPNSYFAYIQL